MYSVYKPCPKFHAVSSRQAHCVQQRLFASERASRKNPELEHLTPSAVLTLRRVQWLKKREEGRKNSEHLGLLKWCDRAPDL